MPLFEHFSRCNPSTFSGKAAVVRLAGLALFSATILLAQGVTVSEYAIPTANSRPKQITAGPDGNLWFVESASAGNKIGRITPSGSISEFPLSANSDPEWIAAGPDGALWFTTGGAGVNVIGRITTGGSVTTFAIPTANSSPEGIVAGPDGALWFIEFASNKIGRITTGGTFTEYNIPTASSQPVRITAGPDGALWFTEFAGNQIGRISTGGAITEYSVPTSSSQPYDITSGPDGALWFAEYTGNKIGRITTAGSVTEFPLAGGSSPVGITSGADGALWFAESGSNNIGRITTSGAVNEYSVPTTGSGPYGVTKGPDSAIWFTEFFGNNIGRLSPGGRRVPVGVDFNGDGKGDTLVFRPSDGFVSQWLSNGIGGWSYQPGVYIGGAPGAFTGAQLLAGDFNGDGKTDLLIFRSSDGFVAPWFSNGDGTWSYQPWVAIGGGGFSGAQLVTGDFNGDGKTDVLVFRSSDGYVSPWLSNGDGTWSYQPRIFIGGFPAAFPGAQILTGDFNGDGKTDILIFRPSDGFVSQWLSNGAGGWNYQPGVYIGGGGFAGAQILTGDFNGDGKTDILIFRSSDGFVSQWLSNGAGGWNYQPDFYIGGAPGAFTGAQLVAGDYNGDGKADVLIFRASDGLVAEWLSNGDGTWTYESLVAIGGGGFTGAQLLTGDFNGDGKADALIFRASDGFSAPWLSNGAGAWNYQQRVFIGGAPGAFPSAEMITDLNNGDGNPAPSNQ